MKYLPSYLKLGEKPRYALHKGSGEWEDYQALLAIWLIDISLSLGWLDNPPRSSLEAVFGSAEFISITGLRDLEYVFSGRTQSEIELHELFEGPDAEPEHNILPESIYMQYLGARRRGVRPSERDLRLTTTLQRKIVRAILLQGRAAWLERGMNANLPLFRNVDRLERLVLLNEIEKAILTFAVALAEFPAFSEALSPSRFTLSDVAMVRVLSTATGHDVAAVQKALRRDGSLLASGVLEIDHDEEPLTRKLHLVHGLHGIILNPMADDTELSQKVVHRAGPCTLSLKDFPHLEKDTGLLLRYLNGALSECREGVNILLYGPPGTGKTEYAKALIHALDWELYEISHADIDGDPISPRMRLQSLVFSQRALRAQKRSALLFDEVEDVFPGNSGHDFAQSLGGRRRDLTTVHAKAWINRALENNRVPTIWITNDADMDPAYLRRFDYSVELTIPPHSVRREIVKKLVGRHVSDPATLDTLADLNDLLPAQLERAAKVVELAGLRTEQENWDGIVQTLERSRALMGQKRRPLTPFSTLPYRLEHLNADVDLHVLAQGLHETGRGNLCLYGPPGTGKTAFGQWLSRKLNRPLLVKRASELMSKWVGENEKNIARAFAEAEQDGAILMLDEVDSFLQDRRQARAQWETTLVNEMLTQMEAYRGIFIASTNLMDNLDAASLRRFDLKVRFSYLQPDQSAALLDDYCHWLGLESPTPTAKRALERLHKLTPGDFAVVCRQHALRKLRNADDLVDALQAEHELKTDGKQTKIGFL